MCTKGSFRARLTTVVATLSVASLALVSCAETVPLAADPFSDSIEHATGAAPLPPGAYYTSAGGREPRPRETATAYETLAPDDQLPKERIPEIYKRGRIIVGVDQALNLLGFRNASTGELSGFEVALAQELARDIFGDPNAVEFRYVRATERVSMLRSDQVDVVLRTMTVTESRLEAVNFSAPYLTARAGILVGPNSRIESEADLNGAKVCVAADSTPEEIVRYTAPDATLLLVGNWSDCLVALQQSQADVIVADDTILAGINEQDPTTAIVRRGLSVEQYAAGIAKDNDGLVRQVNETMERIRSDGTWQELYDVWFGPFLPQGAQPQPTYAPVPVDEDDPTIDTDSAEGGE